MLGKCQWKILNRSENKEEKIKDVLYSFAKAIEYAPEKRDNRHHDKDPILEPHFKLVSVVHKLVRMKEISVSAAIKDALKCS